MMRGYGLYRYGQYPCDWTALRVTDDFGVRAVDLARPPLRLWGSADNAPPAVMFSCSARQAAAQQLPADLLAQLPDGDNWQAMTRRSLQRLFSWFLIAEDPQRRLDKSAVATLAHQRSLVRHVLSDPNLRSVLIADEVGLGKTVEAGLIVRELLAQRPTLRVLYLAPARLVRNVEREFSQLGLGFRIWVAGSDSDARLSDARVIASIHRAVTPTHYAQFTATTWDVIVVDECHHLSDYSRDGTSPLRKYKLVDELRARLGNDGRLILLSGTPHQGHPSRFNNLLRLLRQRDESEAALAGRVIYRTKDDVTDWDGRPLFPRREVREAVVLDLGEKHRQWLTSIHAYFEPGDGAEQSDAGRRAATWRCAQALQWATSSIEAGLGYLVRQGLRSTFGLELDGMREALEALRPYRAGSQTEGAAELLLRIRKEIGRQAQEHDIDDVDDADDIDMETDSPDGWRANATRLSALLKQGVSLLKVDPDAKWKFIEREILKDAQDEKVVLFAQPIETVTALAGYLQRRFGTRPARIVGNQTDMERTTEIESFWREDGPQFLVSSRAGGEGLNLQIARRLIHVDIPWNPMEMEQRVGRVHRFKSRRTIIVDTLITKDSREVDVYAIARDKLKFITSNLVQPDNFEGVFARVMALVPPDDLLHVMGREPLSPLSERDRTEVERVVTAGFERWRTFDASFRDQQQRIRALDPGEAQWSDLRWLAREQLGADPASGYTALRFTHEDGEVVDSSEEAEVYAIEGQVYAIGDYGGMPVTGPRGAHAALLGLNANPLAPLIRRLAFPDRPAGAAHVRRPENRDNPTGASDPPFGLLFFARHTLRISGTDVTDIALTLHAFELRDGQCTELTASRRAETIRALFEWIVRREPTDAPEVTAALRVAQEEVFVQLARPSEADVENQTRHAVHPLLAVIVA
jgi:superfamily II DNA or RNA helicase